MWLLSTDRAELHFFVSPEDVPDSYGALSHVWDKAGEQTFQDVRRIQNTCAKDGTNPRDFVCEKIRRCCELAERHGYKWVWIDTCCIDKTSSAELSEAINSMYRYYALAGICYAYLWDVDYPPTMVLGEQFEYQFVTMLIVNSNWFQRGWTLQELIAPRFLVFLPASWEVLGSKADFAHYSEDDTDIPATVLRLEISHTAFSISQRMSWFGMRKTTRIEDEAYCLLGLFDIHMPTLYGEGTHAFQRLQEEIMKQSPDTTLFAWHYAPDPEDGGCLLAPAPSAFRTKYTSADNRDAGDGKPPFGEYRWSHKDPGLAMRGDAINNMSFVVTPHGLLAYIPIIVSHSGDTYADLFWATPDGIRYLLCLRAVTDLHEAQRSRRPLYRVENTRLKEVEMSPLDPAAYLLGGQMVQASWQEILIRHRPLSHRHPGQLSDTHRAFIPAIPLQLALHAAFRFDEARMRKFLHESQLDFVEHRNTGFTSQNPDFLRTLPATFTFIRLRNYPFALMIRVGQCRHTQSPGNSDQPQPVAQAILWATVHAIPGKVGSYDQCSVLYDKIEAQSKDPLHDCLDDHVSEWPAFRKTFEVDDGRREVSTVILSFAPCPISPEWTLVLDASYLRWSPDQLPVAAAGFPQRRMDEVSQGRSNIVAPDAHTRTGSKALTNSDMVTPLKSRIGMRLKQAVRKMARRKAFAS